MINGKSIIMIPNDSKQYKNQIIKEINQIIEENNLKVYQVYFFGSFSSKSEKKWNSSSSDIDIFFKFPKYFSNITIARDRTTTMLVEFENIKSKILEELQKTFPETKFHIFAGFDFNFIIGSSNKKIECELIYSINYIKYLGRKF